jgi:hypothetical protein
MGRLVFDDIAAVRELYDHASKCVHHRKSYEGEAEAGLWLVHDHGVYLMSSGIPHLEREDKPESSKVVYARFCNPNIDGESWETARRLVGGDDFAENIPLETWTQAFELLGNDTGGKIVIDVTNSKIEVAVFSSALPAPASVGMMADEIDID